MSKIDKAYKRLEEFALFCDDFESFKSLFFDNLDKDKKDTAIELLLMVCFKLLKSDGERFNDLLNRVDDKKRADLKKWLDESLKKF